MTSPLLPGRRQRMVRFLPENWFYAAVKRQREDCQPTRGGTRHVYIGVGTIIVILLIIILILLL
jgi:hypothetical protein